MQLRNIFSCVTLDDATAKARAARDGAPQSDCREIRSRVCAAGRDHNHSFLLSYIFILFSGCASLALSGCGGGQIIGANANTSAGSLQASPNNISFGSVPLGTTTSASVALVNQGSATVNVSQVTLAGQSFAVSGAGDLPITVPAGHTFNLSVSFSPAAAGMATGTLTIASDAEANGTLVVGLSGTGTAADTPNPPALSSFSCVDAVETGPASDICTVELSTAATSGGYAVSLTSDNAAVSLPASVTVAEGSTAVSFTANVSAVSSTETATLTASAGGVAETFAIQVNAASQVGTGAPELSGLHCGRSSVTGTGTDNCTVTLNAPAPSGGFSVSLASNNSAVGVPASVTVAPGAAKSSFTATIAAVSTTQPATLTASAGGVTETFALQLNAASQVGTNPPQLSGLSCGSSSITGAGTDKCTVTLNALAPSGGFAVSLTSNNSSVSVPASLTVASGAATSSFTATIAAVSTAQTTTLTASAGGVAATFTLQLNAASQVGTTPPKLSELNCGSSSITGAGTDNCTVTLSGAAPSGGFAVSLASNNSSVSVPASATVAAGATTGSFTATIAAVSTTQTATLTASAGGVTETFALQLNAAGQVGTNPPALGELSCGSSSITGAGTDKCTVTLNAPAPSGGFAVSLASNNSAVSLPASVTVAAGATTGSFTATIAAVSTTQTATLTASAGGVAQTFALQLSAGVPGLSINATSIAFGNVSLNTPATQSVTLTSTGTAGVTVSLATVVGSGFTVSGATFPLTLSSSQSATISVQFDPTVAGAAGGTLTIVSTSLTNPTVTIGLSGTGVAAVAYQVNLSWDAPTSSSDPVAGYNVYRTPSSASSYVQLNSTVVTGTTYVDSSVQDGQTYDYIVESVDAAGVTSAPSNTAVVPIP